MALPYYLAQRDAKRHSKCAVLIVIKFFKLRISREKLKGAKGQYPPAHHQIPRKERRKTFPFLSSSFESKSTFVHYCHKVFQTSNIETEIKKRKKAKGNNLACTKHWNTAIFHLLMLDELLEDWGLHKHWKTAIFHDKIRRIGTWCLWGW